MHQGCCGDVLRMFKGCFGDVVLMFYGCLKDVSGMLRVALSLRFAPTFHRVQESLQEVIKKMPLARLVGAPPREVAIHRQRVLRLFMSQHGEDAAAKRALLLFLPNGDWRRTDRIEVYTEGTHLHTLSDKDLRDLIAGGLQYAMCATPPAK